MKKHLLIDTGFWIGLADDRDQHHQDALDLIETVQRHKILVPWPITYEVLRTKHTKRFQYLEAIKKALAHFNCIFVEDAPYREECLAACLNQRHGGRGFSLVDMILRSIIDGYHHEISHFITFNPRDFYDICGQRQVGILPEGIHARR